MKIRYLILILIFFSCQTKTEKPISKNSKIEIENRKFFIGDINNDEINDTAFVNYKWNLETNEIECGKNNCDINIEFTENIPKITIAQSLGIVVAKIEDLNNDNANEIIIFSRTTEGWWNKVSVWSFKSGTWNEIAETKAFISEDKDFENRIIKEKGKYYLIGENKLEEDENGNFKKVKVKVTNGNGQSE